ncbi:MAG: hemerythrin [Desulfuromonas sp.]|nr:MAG: hemerythrin [Desulfuromonas sp.]
MLTDWNSNLETGHDEIDAQHRKLLEHFQLFSDACRNGKGKQQITELCTFLESYVVEHFDSEESLMTRYNYPFITTHRLEHKGFTAKLRHLKYEVVQDRITLPLIIETSENLLRWLLEHILKTDVQMAEFFRSQTPS